MVVPFSMRRTALPLQAMSSLLTMRSAIRFPLRPLVATDTASSSSSQIDEGNSMEIGDIQISLSKSHVLSFTNGQWGITAKNR